MAGETRTILVALALAAAAGACGGPDEERPSAGSDDATLAADPARSGAQEVPGVEAVPRPEQTMAAGRLSPVNNSGVTGSVNVRGIGERTEVAMNVTGLPAGTVQVSAAVVQGTCEAAGADVAPLGTLVVGAGAIAALTDTLDLPPGTVLNGEHALVVRGEGAGPAVPPLACSPLPRWERLPPGG